MNLVDKRITELEKRVAEFEALLNDHCIMTTGEPAVHKEPPKHDVAREPFMDTINRKVFGAKQEPEDSITISRKVAENKPTFGVPQDAYRQLLKKYEEAQSLIDGAYEIVELYKSSDGSEYSTVWKNRWLENARKHGASGE